MYKNGGVSRTGTGRIKSSNQVFNIAIWEQKSRFYGYITTKCKYHRNLLSLILILILVWFLQFEHMKEALASGSKTKNQQFYKQWWISTSRVEKKTTYTIEVWPVEASLARNRWSRWIITSETHRTRWTKLSTKTTVCIWTYESRLEERKINSFIEMNRKLNERDYY